MTFLEKCKKFIYEAVKTEEPKEEKPKDPLREYPKTVAECIDDDLKYRRGTYTALKAFKRSRPWAGSQADMQEKLRILNRKLAEIYEIEIPKLVFVDKFPSGPCCFPHSKPSIIILQPTDDGRYSVVAFLHEFGHSLGKGEKGACRWSLNLFKRIFPESYEKLEPEGHLLMRKR